MVGHRVLTVFCSFAHADESLRQELERHLSLLRHQDLVSDWYDRKIDAGSDWAEQIDDHLEVADIVLLLISSDFLASDYCMGIEVKRTLERHRAGEARVIPVILRPCDWQTAPFGRLQALPRGGKPITTWQDRDEAFTDVVRSLRDIATGHRNPGISEETNPGRQVSETSIELPILQHVAYRAHSFIGRAGERKKLYSFLVKGLAETGSPVVLALVGIGGAGKSALAAELADAVINSQGNKAKASTAIPKMVLWADLRNESLEQVVSRWLRDFGINPTHETLQQRICDLQTLIGLRKPLLVLDGLQDRSDCETLLPRVSGVPTIVTTRDYRSLPHTALKLHKVEGLTTRDSRGLLRSLAQGQGLKFTASTSDEICRLCNHLPVFIRIIGGALRQMHYTSLEQCVSELKSRGLDELEGHDKAAGVLFGTSWDILTSEDRNLLAVLSVFPGDSFGVNYASFMLKIDDRRSETLLANLANASLIDATKGQRKDLVRYRMHECVRDYARRHLTVESRDIESELTACWSDCRVLEQELAQIGVHELRGADEASF